MFNNIEKLSSKDIENLYQDVLEGQFIQNISTACAGSSSRNCWVYCSGCDCYGTYYSCRDICKQGNTYRNCPIEKCFGQGTCTGFGFSSNDKYNE